MALLLGLSPSANLPLALLSAVSAVILLTKPHDPVAASQVRPRRTDTATAQVDGHRNQPG
jgi:hypothetical protein